MKQNIKRLLLLCLALCLVLCGCGKKNECEAHIDENGDSVCDVCLNSFIESSDINYSDENDGESEDNDSDSSTSHNKTDKNDNSSTSSKNDKDKNDKNDKIDSSCKHTDKNDDGVCDGCKGSVRIYFDFYSINDLHGKLSDGDNHPGVDELTTYFKNVRKTDDNVVLLSAGDMWQGTSESNMTKGRIITDWMNQLDFTAMAIGNHEFDWGEEYVAANAEFAEFPFLAINIYDRSTGKLSEFCTPSVMVEKNGAKIGIIGAIGDCYSSIAVDKCDEVYFKVGRELTNLVKNESQKLKSKGADFIVYMIHDGYGNSKGNTVTSIASSQISSYYDTALSNGYVDLVFGGHTHQGYILKDEYGVLHLQNRGDNQGGISHAEIYINIANDKTALTEAELITRNAYTSLSPDPIVNQLLKKYENEISPANEVLGYNAYYRNSNYMRQLSADLYYKLGMEVWGSKYKIALGGGFTSIRSPYNLQQGDVKYSDVQSLFPFDNQLVLCSIKGRDLKNKFFETDNSSYYISYGDYGQSIKNNIDLNATYYVVVDTYTSDYRYNNLTVVERYQDGVFARDLIADYIKNGGLSK